MKIIKKLVIKPDLKLQLHRDLHRRAAEKMVDRQTVLESHRIRFLMPYRFGQKLYADLVETLLFKLFSIKN